MNALIARSRGPRTLGSVVLRVLVPRALMFAALATVLLVGKVMAVNPSAAPFGDLPSATPTWTAADRAAEPDCVPHADWPEGTPAAEVVVHRFSDRATVRLPFVEAWNLNHNATEVDDLWVLGVCP